MVLWTPTHAQRGKLMLTESYMYLNLSELLQK